MKVLSIKTNNTPNTIHDLMHQLAQRYNILPNKTTISPCHLSPQQISFNRNVQNNMQKSLNHNFQKNVHLENQTQLKIQKNQLSHQVQALIKQNQKISKQLKQTEILKHQMERKWKIQMQLKQKQWNQQIEQNVGRINQLQSHNEALQLQLLSVKDLLRQQQALIIQMHSLSEQE